MRTGTKVSRAVAGCGAQGWLEHMRLPVFRLAESFAGRDFQVEYEAYFGVVRLLEEARDAPRQGADTVYCTTFVVC